LLFNVFGMRLFFLTIPKSLKQYTLFKKDYPFRSPIHRLCKPEAHTHVLHVFMGSAFPYNDIGGVALSFH